MNSLLLLASLASAGDAPLVKVGPKPAVHSPAPNSSPAELPVPGPLDMAPPWCIQVGRGVGLYPEGGRNEGFLELFVPMYRVPQGWSIGLLGLHNWSLTGQPTGAQSVLLGLRSAHGALWTEWGLGAGRFTFQMPEHEALGTPAWAALASMGLQLGALHAGVALNAHQGGGWLWRDGQEVLYPGRVGIYWFGGIGW